MTTSGRPSASASAHAVDGAQVVVGAARHEDRPSRPPVSSRLTTARPRKPAPPVTMTRRPVQTLRPSGVTGIRRTASSSPASPRGRPRPSSATRSSNVVSRLPAELRASPWWRRPAAAPPRSGGSSARRSRRSRCQSRPTWPKATSHELAHRVRLAGGDDVVVRLVLLEHQPHRLDVVAGVAPVALRVEVAEVELAPACPA